MAKWADYGVSEVRYNTEHTHIVKVKVQEDKGDTFGAVSEWTRSQVVTALDQKKTFVTIVKNKTTGNWDRGAAVEPIIVGGTKYIRTDKNSKASDNLGNLPEF